MKRGALVMMDALGFKGIWRRPAVRDAPDLVITKLRSLTRDANAHIDSMHSQGRPQDNQSPTNLLEMVSASFLSDSVVVGVAIKGGERLVDAFPNEIAETMDPALFDEVSAEIAVLMACRYASAVMGLAAKSLPVLAYRGCISFGDFELEDNFIVGPAVDEAAASMDAAHGGLVWLLPSALRVFGRYRSDDLRRSHPNYCSSYIPYSVSLKGGVEYQTFAVSPFKIASDSDDRDRIVEAILGSFVGNLEVEVKRQYTEAFLAACSTEYLPPEDSPSIVEVPAKPQV